MVWLCITTLGGDTPLLKGNINMPHYAVEIERTAYYTIHVEAKDKDEAEKLAWSEIERDIDPDGDANWLCTDISEQHIPTNVKETQ